MDNQNQSTHTVFILLIVSVLAVLLYLKIKSLEDKVNAVPTVNNDYDRRITELENCFEEV